MENFQNRDNVQSEYIRNLREKVQHLETVNYDLSQQLNDSKEDQESLIKKYEHQIKKLNHQINDMNFQMSKQKQEHQGQVNQISMREKTSIQFQQEYQIEKLKIKYENEIDKFKQDIQFLRRKNIDFEIELEKKNNQHERQVSEIKNLNKIQQMEYALQIKAVESQQVNKNQTIQIEDLKTQNSILIVENQELQQKIIECRQNFEKILHQRDNMLNNIQNQMNSQNEKNIKELSILKRNESKFELLNSAKKELEFKIEQYKNNEQIFYTQKENLNTQISIIQNEKKDLQIYNMDLEKQNQILKDQLRQINILDQQNLISQVIQKSQLMGDLNNENKQKIKDLLHQNYQQIQQL